MDASYRLSPCSWLAQAYAAHFDDLLSYAAQRRSFRDYLAGLLLPNDRT